MLLAFLLTQVGYAQDDEPLTGHDRMLGDTLTEDTYRAAGLTFTVETQTRFRVVGEALVETQTQYITTPFGKTIEGMPSGLGCERWESWDKERCKVRDIVESGPDVWLITTGRIYTYSVSDDMFHHYGDIQIDKRDLRVTTPLKGAENIYILTQSGDDPVLVGLLIGYEGVWAEIELERHIDFNKKFKVVYKGGRVIFRFGLFKSMVCDISDHVCTTRGIQAPE